MSPEQKTRLLLWVEALESGKYSQTVGALRDGSGYCCLGVGCDVYRQATGEGVWQHPDDDDDDTRCVYTCTSKRSRDFVLPADSSVVELPRTVANWFGLQQNPEFRTEVGFRDAATRLNDDLCYDFMKIAAAIRLTYGLPPRDEKK